ncbi:MULTISPECIES: hypothetical protein [Spirosoma]|uniref:Uncharacterized protein n=1 Tax=Spirosoma sordidisoli TaxID=2502893 RepID=A0A4Q2UJX6_9BACT|nr:MULTISPECIES: hypothetical protein [Spirosoma]RYC69807.1 hypothetical protein EQG79_14535 [Spirosoma sordidisoli]
MSDFDWLIVDELRREFRRTRPPAKAILNNYTAGIFRLTEPHRIGYRIFWYPSGLVHPTSFCHHHTQFDLVEILDV